MTAGVGDEAAVEVAAAAALVVEEEWVIEVAMMTNIKDLDLATDLVAVGLEMAVVLVAAVAAEDLDHHVVAVVDLEGMLIGVTLCYHFHF